MIYSVSAYGHSTQTGMAIHIFGLYGYPFHHSDLRFLLERPLDPRIVALRADPGFRQEGGWSQGVVLWFRRPRPCRAISVIAIRPAGEMFHSLPSRE
jgi:hypothetical protein